jgi:hypothetical protein
MVLGLPTRWKVLPYSKCLDYRRLRDWKELEAWKWTRYDWSTY